MSEADAQNECPEAGADAVGRGLAPPPEEPPRPTPARRVLNSPLLYLALALLFLGSQQRGWLPSPTWPAEEQVAPAEEVTVDDLLRSPGTASFGGAVLVLVPLIAGSGMLLGYVILRACNVRVFPRCEFPTVPWNGWHLARAAVVYVVVMRLALAGAAWNQPLVKAAGWRDVLPLTVLLALATNAAGVATCLFVMVLIGSGGRDPLRLLGLREAKPAQRAALGVAGMVMMQPLLLLAVLVVLVLGPMVGVKWRMQAVLLQAQGVSSAAFLVLCFSTVVVAPVTEEILFRGFLYATMRRHLGPLGAICLAAGLFAVAHGHPSAVPSLFLLGFLLGYLYERTGSLTASIAAHAANNLYSMLIVLVVHRGG